MKPTKNPVVVSEDDVKASQEPQKKTDGEKMVFKLDPDSPTSVINGNKILFIGIGAREVTLVANTNKGEE